jgi:predicted metal-dependent hydrolase
MVARPALADLDAATREALGKGITEFNSWRFYDCHETLEDVWLEVGTKGEEGTLANFYQGIIKVAAGFHHLLRDNHHGAVTLLSDAFRLLETYRPATLGVDVERLLEDVRPCLERINELGPGRLSEFDRGMIPRIEWEQGTGNLQQGARSSERADESG